MVAPMRKNCLRLIAPAAVATMLLLSASPTPAATIGSDLLGTPDTGACTLAAFGERSCTVVQGSLGPRFAASGGLVSPTAGTVTRWRVRAAIGSPATTAVAL
jgi:hypothetical protein